LDFKTLSETRQKLKLCTSSCTLLDFKTLFGIGQIEGQENGEKLKSEGE
jgi:hypothetical protein